MPPDQTQPPIPPEPTDSSDSTSSPQASPQSEDTGASPSTFGLEASVSQSQNSSKTAQFGTPPEPEVPPTDAKAVAGKQSELGLDVLPVAVEAPRESENLEAVKDTSPQNTPVATSEPLASIPTEQPPSPVSAPTSQPSNIIGSLLQKAKSAIQNRKTKKLEKILAALDRKAPPSQGYGETRKISNDEVQKLLNVSDATATRYLSLLEQQGKVKQAGKTGKYTFYTKTP